ncbi:MAG TPA: EFR1 family ferrodoxin [Eubacteriales bacterium]|nr:EFR1 family ferrodoxin [Eubacteriales bacterium]HRU84268.1 EFR1 family ferrodoxin [Eubacteriales bacterium]
MKALLIVFSGTGNTKLAADKIAAELTLNGVETQVYRVGEEERPLAELSDFDIFGFGYPVHAFNPPEIFFDFVKSLPAVNNKYAFVFKISGEPLWMNGASSARLVVVLKRKGFCLGFERHLLMPYNIMFRHSEELTKQMYFYTLALAKLCARKAIAREREGFSFNLFKRLISFVFRIEWPFAKFNGRFYKVDLDKCIMCRKCERECPAKNIKIEEERFKFGKKCAMCMRCSFHCPTDAFKIGLLGGWKINGKYDFKELAADESVPFPYVTEGARGFHKIYARYFKKADAELAAAGIALNTDNAGLERAGI